ncbi:MAG: sulfatase [Thermoanaerobaculia bacterium]|nr:MAG: sulfatase [Thermoanaerobaculia bacterium]MBZ0101772.1 sulfatase [Thermoanaerobaculia bacterium]
MCRAAAPLFAALFVAACGGAPRPDPAAAPPRPAPSRGFVLVSIDTLRADRVGAWGYGRPTTPFLDRLAARAALFERAYSPIPATLPAHLSMFTGLEPGQHDVDPPSGVLAAGIPTLPELFRAAGYRTAGHSEGGYMAGGYGFARGFEVWTDSEYSADSDVERTFGRGAEFLRGLAPGERFFLFLHTYAVHDPYAPAPEFAAALGVGARPPGAPEPTGENLAAFNRGELAVDADTARWYSDLYDASVRQVDAALERLWGEIERLGLADEVTLIVTADHGEEFLEHGRLAHTQIYRENLHVPLLVLSPGIDAPRRIGAPVGLVDLLPTLVDLAGLERPAVLAGTSLAPWLGRPELPLDRVVWAENDPPGGREESVLVRRDGETWQLLRARSEAEPDGFWVSRRIRFDHRGARLDFSAVAFAGPREVEVRADGRTVATVNLTGDWSDHAIPLPGDGKHAIELATPDCRVAREAGGWDDDRCLSFKVRGPAPDRVELYALDRDPDSTTDLSERQPARLRELTAELARIRHQPVAPSGQADLSPAQLRQLEALGYL